MKSISIRAIIFHGELSMLVITPINGPFSSIFHGYVSHNQRLNPPWLARRVSSPAAHLHSPGLPLWRRLGLVGLLAEVRMGEGAPKKGPS